MQKASRPAGKVGGRPGTGKTEARTQDGPILDPRVQEIVTLVKALDDNTRADFKTEFGSKPSEIKDPDSALKWLLEKVEPF